MPGVDRGYTNVYRKLLLFEVNRMRNINLVYAYEIQGRIHTYDLLRYMSLRCLFSRKREKNESLPTISHAIVRVILEL